MSNSLQQTELSLTQVQIAFKKIVKRIQEAHENSEPLDKLERDLVAEVMNLGHACLQDFIDAAGDGDIGPQLTTGKGEVVRRSQEKHRRAYRSVFGEFEIERYVYCRREKTRALAKPLDQKLGLPADEVSYVLEDWLGNLSVDIPFEAVTGWLNKTLGIKVSSSMAHRRVGKLGSYVEGMPARMRYDPFGIGCARGRAYRWCAARPPANGCDPFGIGDWSAERTTS